ncbi:hypothetical protein GDO81_014494 [Engystomops pustulosus]|uniref:Ig-like domain-containing protein n=1 Tax=Engystomops pustulosus TaxID=76066 RepID=A0AAV7BAT2_ENGPU|nr:hypothetical protein GDO81_014494 [Engystomops pustulosus]
MWILVISVLFGPTVDGTSAEADIQLIPKYPTFNGSITMNVTGISENILTFSWFKGPRTSVSFRILSYSLGYSPPLTPGILYSPRITAYDNGSLQIKDLKMTDAGEYIVRIYTMSSLTMDISANLNVYETVRKPIIASSHCPVQEGDLFVLVCVTSNAEKITWSRQNKSFPMDATISADSSTVTFHHIKHGDAGGYQCEAENLVSKESSDIFNVLYITGPSSSGLNPTVIAAIVCGTLLAIALIGCGSYLLYQRHILPLREAQKNPCRSDKTDGVNKKDISNKIDGPVWTCVLPPSKHEAAEVYENVLELPSDPYEPCYKDLQCKSENVYNEIIR